MKKYIVLLLWVLGFSAVAQKQQPVFNTIYSLIDQKNFFKAKEIFNENQDEISPDHQLLISIFLENAFNELEASNQSILNLLQSEHGLPDSLLLAVWQVREDNSAKLYDYRGAKQAATAIIAGYSNLLSTDEKEDVENNLKIWTALENEPPQQVTIQETARQKMEKDKAGLNNLKITTSSDTIQFIFDTGANLSTTSSGTARKMNMKIIPVDIEVGTITGQSIQAQLAICPVMNLGLIEIKNAVFLVLNDSALSFPQIGYQIYGILGFPVIEALKEIQITQDGYFIVPKEETRISFPSNMAMNGLTPLICMDGMHFTFDTGADQTFLYQLYYQENKADIESKYSRAKFSFAGAGGSKEFEGFTISRDFHIMDQLIHLSDIQLSTEKIKDKESVYGNIGQDVIRQFARMTLNFDRMFIRFE